MGLFIQGKKSSSKTKCPGEKDMFHRAVLVCDFFKKNLLWPYLWHVDVPGSGIEPAMLDP